MPQTPDVLLIDTGVANLRSMQAGLGRAGARVRIAGNPRDVANADRVVLPGVGAFGPAVERLHAMEIFEPLRARIESGWPTLAVCLGLQLLGTSSEESPGAIGVGAFDAETHRFNGGSPVPQLGWNQVSTADAGDARFLTEEAWFYFANSYRIVAAPSGWSCAQSDYDGSFVAALERGDVLACQFHPELSSTAGNRLLQRWVAGGER